MKAMTTKLSCEKLAQVISIKKVKDYWCVEQKDTKNLLNLNVEHNTFTWRYTDYGEALSQYISVVKRQAHHIALMSL